MAKSKKQKAKTREEKPARVYRDGFGNVIEDTDLQLQAKLKAELADKFARHIEYEGNLRNGEVIYIEGNKRAAFWNEMGGGNCMVYITIPSEARWEIETGFPLSRRNDILEFMATRVKAEQASNCRYEIKGDSISFYYS
jgi:hypothetical protein